MRRMIWLITLLATVASAQDSADDTYVAGLLALEKKNPVPVKEIEERLAKATASQRGRYEYLYFRAVTAYLKNKPEAGDAFRDATLAAMKNDGFDKAECEKVKERLSTAAGTTAAGTAAADTAAWERVKAMLLKNRRGSGVSTGHERLSDNLLEFLGRTLTVEELSKIQQAAKEAQERLNIRKQ